jgi:hypothetical protein
MAEPVDRSSYPTRKARLDDPADVSQVLGLTPGERMALVWQLTLDAWAFKEGLIDEPRLRRDVVHVERRGR